MNSTYHQKLAFFLLASTYSPSLFQNHNIILFIQIIIASVRVHSNKQQVLIQVVRDTYPARAEGGKVKESITKKKKERKKRQQTQSEHQSRHFLDV